MGLQRGVGVEEFDDEGLAVRQLQDGAVALAAGGAQEIVGLAQQVAVRARAIGDRRQPGLGEDLVRHFAAPGLEQLLLLGRGRADSLHRRVLEEGGQPLVGGEHDVLVRPLEVEAIGQSLADARILELRPACVEVPALNGGRRAVVQLDLLDAAFAYGGKIVRERPELRRIFLVEVEPPRFEVLEGGRAVAVVRVAHPVEIVLPDVHRQRRGPIIGHALELDIAARLVTRELVGTGAEWRLEGRGLEIAALPPGGGKDRQASDEEVDVARALRREAHEEGALVLRLRRGHFPQQAAIDRVALLLQHAQREGRVPGCEFRAVVEARLGAQQEAVGELVGAPAHRTGNEAVDRVRLVAGIGHQAIEGRVHPGRAIALEHVDVEGVVRVEVLVAGRVLDLHRQQPALGRLRVHVAEVGEVRWQLQLAEGREAMALDLLGRAIRRRRESCAGGAEQTGAQSPSTKSGRAELQGGAAGDGHSENLRDRGSRDDSEGLCRFSDASQQGAGRVNAGPRC